MVRPCIARGGSNLMLFIQFQSGTNLKVIIIIQIGHRSSASGHAHVLVGTDLSTLGGKPATYITST